MGTGESLRRIISPPSIIYSLMGRFNSRNLCSVSLVHTSDERDSTSSSYLARYLGDSHMSV